MSAQPQIISEAIDSQVLIPSNENQWQVVRDKSVANNGSYYAYNKDGVKELIGGFGSSAVTNFIISLIQQNSMKTKNIRVLITSADLHQFALPGPGGKKLILPAPVTANTVNNVISITFGKPVSTIAYDDGAGGPVTLLVSTVGSVMSFSDGSFLLDKTRDTEFASPSANGYTLSTDKDLFITSDANPQNGNGDMYLEILYYEQTRS